MGAECSCIFFSQHALGGARAPTLIDVYCLILTNNSILVRVREFEQHLKDLDFMTPSGVANFLIKLSEYLYHICQNSNLLTSTTCIDSQIKY